MIPVSRETVKKLSAEACKVLLGLSQIAQQAEQSGGLEIDLSRPLHIDLSRQTIMRLPPCASKALLILWIEADDAGQGEVTNTDLAWRYGLDRRAVTRALLVLQQEQIATITRHGREDRFAFVLTHPPPEKELAFSFSIE